MKMKKEGIVYRSEGQPFRYQGWPTVIRDEDGNLYAACSGYRSAHICPMGKNLLFISRDGGERWSCPIVINDTWFDDRDAGLTYLGNGRMIMTYFHNEASLYTGRWREGILRESDPTAIGAVEAILDSYPILPEAESGEGAFIKISDNYGLNWSEAIEVPISSPHGPTFTASGRLIYLGRTMGNVEKRIDLYESFDNGEHWEYVSTVPHLPEGDIGVPYEPHIVELADGTLVGAIRIEKIEPGKPKELTIYMTYSTDGGKTFTVPKPTGINGTPPHLLLLSDGRLLMSYGRREAPCGSRARISEDGGVTFGDEFILSESPDYDIGYPSTVELDDGTLLTVHYQRYGDDDKTSILYTKWKI